MKKFREYWSVFALVLIFAVGFIMRQLAPTPVRAAGAAPVTVENFPATQNVNVTNTPAVNAAESGAWNVGITGTPNVNVTNTPSVNAAESGTWNVGITGTPNVNIANTTPFPVTAADNPALQPYTDSCFISTFSYDGFGYCSFDGGTVPVGKRFVIETVSGEVSVAPGVKPLIQLQYCTAVKQAYFALPAALQANNIMGASGDVYVASQQVRLYADNSCSKVAPAVRVDLNGGGGSAVFSFSGYLVNLP